MELVIICYMPASADLQRMVSGVWARQSQKQWAEGAHDKILPNLSKEYGSCIPSRQFIFLEAHVPTRKDRTVKSMLAHGE